MGLKGQKGIALVTVLGFMMFLVLTITSIIVISNSEVEWAKTQNNSTRAFYVSEGGLQRAVYDLGQDSDWLDTDGDGMINGIPRVLTDVDSEGFYLFNYASAIKTALGGEFTVRLKDIAGSSNEIWVKSTGIYDNGTRVVKAKMTSLTGAGNPAGVTSAIAAEGTVTVKGSATVTPEGSIEEGATLSFENIFGLTMAEMREIAQNYNYYGTIAFNSDIATGITWVNTPGTQAQITQAGWTGDGILVVEGDLRITGGIFDGVIWVGGELDMAGNPAIINGGIFVESGATIDTTLTGNAQINYSTIEISEAFTELQSLPPDIGSWQEG